MKILLINLPLKSANRYEPLPFPLGLGYVAAAVRQAGHQVALLDACLGPVRKKKGESFHHIGLYLPEIIEQIKQYKPDLIGIAVPFTSRLKTTLEITAEIQRCCP
ncbi:MAG: cobalamin B12-binding domain-containing protein, partial [bacterium]